MLLMLLNPAAKKRPREEREVHLDSIRRKINKTDPIMGDTGQRHYKSIHSADGKREDSSKCVERMLSIFSMRTTLHIFFQEKKMP